MGKLSGYPQATTLSGTEIIPVIQEGTNRIISSSLLLKLIYRSSYVSLATALTAIGSSDKTLVLDADVSITSDTVIPATTSVIVFKPCIITIATGMTLTINGSFDAGLYKIFNCVGTGQVVFTGIKEVYPDWWLDNTSPGTTDMTDAVIASINSISTYGGTVYLQPKTYLCSDVSLISNVNVTGSGWNTILKKGVGASYILTCDSGSSSVASNIQNIIISDLQLEGLSVDVAFSEHNHAINLNGVSHILIERCKIIEFEGDAIYLGSSNTPATERHNEDITIRNCYFDGVNNENRNGVSIIDGTHITIDNNYFVNVTKSTMPGAINIEPDANAFAIIRYIKIINNYLYNTGGNVGAICMVLPLNQAGLTNPSKHITIENNTIITSVSDAIAIVQVGTVTDDTEPNIIRITDNYIYDANKAFEFLGIKDLILSGNVFESTNASAYIGYTAADDVCRDITIQNNTFRKCGISNSIGGYGISVFEVDNLSINSNIFNDCGKQDGSFGYAIDFDSRASTGVSITNNKFLSPNAYTTKSIVKETAHTFTPSTNYILGNDFGSIATLNMEQFDYTPLVGATPSVKSVKKGIEYFECDNDGAITITQFEDGEPGKIIIVRIDNNTTIQNNAAIYLAGGADFSGDASDIITLLCVAVDEWREVSRSVN